MKRTPIEGLPPMFPGGNRVGAAEEAAVLEVLRSKRLFRYYGAVEGPSAVAAFERDVAQQLGATHALAVASGTTATIWGITSPARCRMTVSPMRTSLRSISS